MYFWILGSGSKGNSCVIRTDQALFLIDNGFSGKELLRRLANVEILPQDIDGIIVSHEHTDHVKGVGVFARKFKTPIYINKSTYFRTRKLLNNTEIRFFESGGSIEYADLIVGTFSLSHDAGDPVGFVLGQKSQKNGEVKKLGYVTDLGEVSPLVEEQLTGVKTLVLESNHDEHLLLHGPYPWALKQRIRGSRGHLSNRAAGEFISRLVRQNGLQRVTLAHLSEKNNDPELARDTILKRIEQDCGRTIQVHIAPQDEPMDEIVLSQEDSA